MPETKPWYESVTLWLNVAAVLIGGILAILDNAQVLSLTPAMVAWLTIAVAVLNAIVRIVKTSMPITGTPAAKALQARMQARPPSGVGPA